MYYEAFISLTAWPRHTKQVYNKNMLALKRPIHCVHNKQKQPLMTQSGSVRKCKYKPHSIMFLCIYWKSNKLQTNYQLTFGTTCLQLTFAT